MATIVFKMPPLPDPDSFEDSMESMSDDAKLIQSMRGVAATASLLIPAWHSLLAAETAYPVAETGKDYAQLVMMYFMRQAMLDTVLVYLRRFYESSDRSLSTGTMVRLLSIDSTVEALRAWVKKVRGPSAITDLEFNARVDILKLGCAAHLDTEGHIEDPLLARFGIQTQLARHAANKQTAHITLDDYKFSLDDLHQLIKNALAIATNIQAILGKNEIQLDIAECDKAAYTGATQFFGCEHAGGLLSDNWTADTPNPSTPQPAPTS